MQTMTANNVIILLGLLCSIRPIHGIPYEVFVYTGDVFSAGTDAKVFITLYGDDSKSTERELDNKRKNDFERNHIDAYDLDLPDLGQLKKINIRHDNSWFGSGWFLEKVLVKDKDGCVFEFPCHKWLASNWGDKKVSRDLVTKTRCQGSSKKNKGCANTNSSDSKISCHVCKRGLGMSSGAIANSQITASSSYDDKHQPFHGRLKTTVKGSRGGWCSAFADDTEFLQINFNDTTSIGGIATQGQAMFNNWVTKYSMSFTTNRSTWEILKENGKVKAFTGNSDRNTVITHRFKEIQAKGVRIHPLAWEGLTNCMRVELYECDEEEPQKRRKKEKHVKKMILQSQEPTGLTILAKAVLYLRFDAITDSDTILDQSDLHNDARIVNFARLSRFSEKCGRGVDVNGGDILLNGQHFVNKPRKFVTIATWVKLYSNEGMNSVFDTIGGTNSTHTMGQYHMEITNGSIRWFHRNEHSKIIFSVLTEVIVPAHIWTHVACTYDSQTGYAQVFVNAKFVMREEGLGLLSQDWQVRAGIGEHKGERLLDGLIDEFYVSDKALSQDEIKKLMKRCEFEKECFSPIGMEDLKIQDDQITASSILEPHKPYYARLNLISFFDDVKRSAWCSDDDDKQPYLTIDLKTEKTISGVAVQGASVIDSFVTSYKLCYSRSGRKYDCVKENATGEALLGSEDKDNIKIHWLNKLFDARFVRLYPLSWYGENICMRVELYGCITGLLSDTIEARLLDTEIDPTESHPAECSVSCGKGTIKKTHHCTAGHQHPKCDTGQKTYKERMECIEPSCPECFMSMGKSNSFFKDSVKTSYSGSNQSHMANSDRGKSAVRDVIAQGGTWCAKNVDTHQYLDVDLDKPVKVTGVSTQGEVTADRWVSKYRISYSINGPIWNNYTEDYRLKVFKGNDDKDTMTIRHLKHPVTARYLRVHPLEWHGGLICMRAEIFGCDHSPSTITHIPVKVRINEEKTFLNGSLANPKHQVAAVKKDASAHLKNVVYTNGEYRHLSDASENILHLIPGTTIMTSKKAEPHAQTVSTAKQPMRVLPHSAQGKGRTITAVATKTGSSRFHIQSPHVQPHFIQKHVLPVRIPRIGQLGSVRKGVTQKFPINAYANQKLEKKKINHTIQAFHNLGHPESLFPNRLEDGQFAALPMRLDFRNFQSQRLIKTPYIQKALKTGQKYDARTLNAAAIRLPKISIHNAASKKLPLRLHTNIRYFPARPKMFTNPRQTTLKNVGNLRKVSQPNLYIPKLFPRPASLISLSLKAKFKDSSAHHFLEERLSKQRTREEKAAKNSQVGSPHDAHAYSWSRFGACSVTCGRGVKERFRKCNAADCLAEGSEIQIIPCFNPPCRGSIEWSAYSPCSASCGSGLRTRTRTCNGINCPRTGKEVSTIPCKTPPCPILNLDFEDIDNHVIIDQSGKGNHVFMEKNTRIVPYKGLCGHHADIGYHGDLLLDDRTFRDKPKYGISIACWVNLQGTSGGSHSIFSTSKIANVGQIIGGYHFEVDDGKVRWFHRSRSHIPVFSVITNDVIQPNTWYHVVGTYSSTSGKANVYIDGKLQAWSQGSGLLDDDWGQASVGSFDFDRRFLRGEMDDFFMYDYEISPKQIHELLRIKCPAKKSNKH